MSEPNRSRRSARRGAVTVTADQVVASQVRWLRERRGISQQGLADTLGWTQSQVARLELGKRSISVADLFGLAWALDVAPVFLLAGSFTEPADVPITEQLRLTPEEVRRWVRGHEPIPGSNYRAFYENIPDDEWLGVWGEAIEQRRKAAAFYEETEAILEAGGSRRPGSTVAASADREAELADERARRRKQLAAAKRTRKRKSDNSDADRG